MARFVSAVAGQCPFQEIYCEADGAGFFQAQRSTFGRTGNGGPSYRLARLAIAVSIMPRGMKAKRHGEVKPIRDVRQS